MDPTPANVLVWPTELRNAVGELQLLGGFNPDGVRFDLERRAVLAPQAKATGQLGARPSSISAMSPTGR